MVTYLKKKIKQGLFTSLTKVMGDGDGQVVLPTLSGPARGLRFRLDLNAFSEPPYFYGTYELNQARAIANICRPGFVAWDCGIYLGYYTNHFSRLVGPEGAVVAFEPDPRNIQRTKANLAINGFKNVQFVEAAVGAPTGEIDFIVSCNTNSHIPGAYVGRDYPDYATREQANETIRVPSISLDEAYQNPAIPNPNLIKIDIEGSELVALAHATRIATELRPAIVVELHNPECDEAAWKFAKRANYALHSLDTGLKVEARCDVGGTLLCLPDS